MKIIVIGAGILGAAVGRALAVAGNEVTLLDRSGAGAGTSATTFAWTNANAKLDLVYQRLNIDGMAEHERLARELPGPRSAVRSGNVRYAVDDATALTEHVELLRSRRYPAHLVDRATAGRITGGVPVPAAATAIAHFPDEGYVLPDLLVANLVADARRRGAHLEIGEVAGIDEGPDTVVVETTDGRTRHADRVVVAAGRWTTGLLAGNGHDLPMVDGVHRGSPIVGLLGYVRSPQVDLRCVLHTPGLNLRPTADGGVVVQAPDLNEQVDPGTGPSETVTAEITRRFAGATGRTPAAIEFRVGLRSMPADGLTVAGFLDPGSRVYVVVSHSGITLGPLLGRLVADEVGAGREQEQLAPFRPDRFAVPGGRDAGRGPQQ